MKINNEIYMHLQNCLGDLEDALKVFNSLHPSIDTVIAIAAFKYAVIAYCRPYTLSKGPEKKFKLDESYVPEKFLWLHDDLVTFRNKIYAHHDRDILEAKLSIHEINGEKIPIRLQNKIDPTKIISHHDEIIELVKLSIDNIADRLEYTQKSL